MQGHELGWNGSQLCSLVGFGTNSFCTLDSVIRQPVSKKVKSSPALPVF
jgi:hypothetical protein